MKDRIMLLSLGMVMIVLGLAMPSAHAASDSRAASFLTLSQ